MYEFHHEANRYILDFDSIPLTCSQIQIKVWSMAASIITSMQEGCSDQISSTCCDVYVVAVAGSLRKASETPYLPLKGVFEVKWYAVTYTSVYEGVVRNINYARCILRIGRICR